MSLLCEFERCWPWLAAANVRGGEQYTKADIWEGIESGHFTLWAGERSAVLTELRAFPRETVCLIFLGGGDLDELRSLEQRVAGWSQGQGITRLQILGRRGWLRALEGYEERAVFMEKML